jgi:hypothetical protein
MKFDAMRFAFVVWSIVALLSWFVPWWRLRARSWARIYRQVFRRLQNDRHPSVQAVVEAGWVRPLFIFARLLFALGWPYAALRYWFERSYVLVRAVHVRRLRGRPFGASR